MSSLFLATMEEKSEMEAAQQLVQLSSGEEEDSAGTADNETKSKRVEKEGGSSDQAETSAPGGKGGASKEEGLEEQSRPRKRPRIRSLAELYAVTKPMSSSNGCRGGGIYRKGALMRRPASLRAN